MTLKRKRCTFASAGRYGCSPEPHGNKMLYHTGIEAVVCDIHLPLYLAGGGWTRLNLLCIQCTLNTATVFTTDGESLCEQCALAPVGKGENEMSAKDGTRDGTRMPADGQCVNRSTVANCLVHCDPGENMCAFCKKWFAGAPRPRVRLIPNSSRKCHITIGCAGNMVASVRRYDEKTPPELWWHCHVCNHGRPAEKTQAIVWEDSAAGDLSDALLRPVQPLSADIAEMTEHVRSILHEQKPAQTGKQGAED